MTCLEELVINCITMTTSTSCSAYHALLLRVSCESPALHTKSLCLSLPAFLDVSCHLPDRKLQPSDSQKKLVDGAPDLGRTSSVIPSARPSLETDRAPESITCAAGTVRGEDYNFHFTGKIKDNKLYVRLHLEYEGDDEQQLSSGGKKTIDFTYDPDGDTPEAIAKEIGDEFSLSSTDRDICAAALKEWLAKETPDSAR